jgi:hypothetical protein
VTTLAATSANNSAAPGTLGFIVVFGLAVILVFVFRSMSKHIRKVDEAARQADSASAEDVAQAGGPGGSSPGAGPADGVPAASASSQDRHR